MLRRPILRRTLTDSGNAYPRRHSHAGRPNPASKWERIFPRGGASAEDFPRTWRRPPMKAPEPKLRPVGGDSSPIVSILRVRSSWCLSTGWAMDPEPRLPKLEAQYKHCGKLVKG